MNETVLMRRRQHVEHAVGITIFDPGWPTTLTDVGAVFLHDATLLDTNPYRAQPAADYTAAVTRRSTKPGKQ